MFDRLKEGDTSLSSGEKQIDSLDPVALLASVKHELLDLLNTRTSVTADELISEKRTALNYGIPDLSYFSNTDADGWPELESTLIKTIEAYEPRLLNVSVIIQTVSIKDGTLLAIISGQLKAGYIDEPVSFPLAIDPIERNKDAKSLLSIEETTLRSC